MSFRSWDDRAPEVHAFVLCDWANQTGDGKTNLIGIFDRILVSALPTPSPSFFVYARVLRGPVGELTITIIDPSNNEVGSIGTEWEKPFGPDEPGFVSFIGRMRFQVEQAGVFRFRAHSEARQLAEMPLVVELRQAEGSR